MRKSRFDLPLLMLVLTLCACAWFTPPNSNPEVPTPEPPTSTPADAAIGTVTRIETILRQGPEESSLSPVSGTNPLHDGDFLQVTDGGKGLLDFGDAIRITIFNDTNLGNIRTETEPGASLKIRLLLQKGGFLGTVEPGQGITSIDTPNNGQINVVGTTFFALFDETTGTTTVGNFDGVVNVASGGVQVGLSPGFYLVFSGGPPGVELPIPFTPVDFENEADLLDSPIDGFASLTDRVDDVPTGESKRLDPALMANFFINNDACTAVLITDGSPEAEADIRIFSEVFQAGGCEILSTHLVLPESDVKIMLATLEAITDQGTPRILYFPIDQSTAELFFDVILEFGQFKGSWLLNSVGFLQTGYQVVE